VNPFISVFFIFFTLHLLFSPSKENEKSMLKALQDMKQVVYSTVKATAAGGR